MKLTKYIIFLSLFYISNVFGAQDYNKFVGTAKNDAGKVVYYEDHQVEHNEQGQITRIQTRYLRPNDKKDIFARLESKFMTSSFVPVSTFEDFRNGHQEKTSLENGKLIIVHSNTSTDKKSKESMKITSNMVMGQGYHNYIVSNLQEFKVNEKRTLDFVVPAKQTYYKFDLTYLGKKDEKSNLVTFRLDITNWFLSLFASKIEVDYDPKSKRLMGYRGLTNIEDDNGDNQSLNITFQYPEDKN
jgi:hypothetical protein